MLDQILNFFKRMTVSSIAADCFTQVEGLNLWGYLLIAGSSTIQEDVHVVSHASVIQKVKTEN